MDNRNETRPDSQSGFLTEFVSAFVLSMRYFFKPKPTLNYPHEKNPHRRVSW